MLLNIVDIFKDEEDYWLISSGVVIGLQVLTNKTIIGIFA
jgi:hypothetical protein